MLVEILLGAIGEAALAHAAAKGWQLFKSNEEKKELAQIGAAAIEVGITFVPALSEDLRTDSFARGVFVPVLEALILDPSRLPDPDGLASEYVAMFVRRFATETSTDEVLQRVFQTPQDDLVAAFSGVIRELRSQFYASKYWRDMGQFMAQEQALAGVNTIIGILEGKDHQRLIDVVDLDAAKRDAKRGSGELRNWPKDISGLEIPRPELELLRRHIEASDKGTALLIGEAGSGKSATLAKLTEQLEIQGHVVFGIKADTLPTSVSTLDDIGLALGMEGPLALEIEALARSGRVIVIIDQLDAVSDVMDRSSERMRLLLRLVRQIRDQALPVHVIVSSRPFEAAHDARFEQLQAEEFKLSLPSVSQVLSYLSQLEIDGSALSDGLKETIRRPFALKLFVQLIERGIAPLSIEGGQLLDRWIATADLGTDKQRNSSLELLQKLAAEMLETETLWRPADIFEVHYKDALARCEACGLISRSGQQIGFSHQSWLDDFQAKSFRTGRDLADYAWANQDSLFVRATVLRSLERLRLVDYDAYTKAINALLWTSKTRRHLKHLIVDVIATARAPTPQEAAWIETLILQDPILANRSFGQLLPLWTEWRPMLGKCLATLMQNPDFHWRAVRALAEEARVDPNSMVRLVKSHWDSPERDGLVFSVAEQSGVITPEVETMIATILGRTQIDAYAVSHFVTTLRADGRTREACRIVGLWSSSVEIDRRRNPSLHLIGKLVEQSPFDFAEELLPWFLQQAAKEVETFRDGIKRYPKSLSLPWDWDYEPEGDKVVRAFKDAIVYAAAADPVRAKPLIERLAEVEIEQVQELAAHAYAAGGAALADEGLDFLLADERRFQMGDASVVLEPGLSSQESGLTSQELVEAISVHLSRERQIELRDRIEGWSLYGPTFGNDDGPETRRRRLQWADENRMELLERLPTSILPPRRNRQIQEWRTQRNRPIARKRGGTMATFVGSPMSSERMSKASENDIFRMLDEVNDIAPERSRRRPLSRDGGVSELSSAFAAFGKDNPERAFNIAETHFVAGRHEHAAGYLVDELSKEGAFPPHKILSLIHELTDRGFSSRTWKTHASWALSRLADNLSGLPNHTIAMLESWLENEPDIIAKQVERRLANELENERQNKREKTVPNALLFHAYGGMRVVPQDNYTVLSAIFHGLIGRVEQAFDEWLDILERHASKAEDPHVWSFLISKEGQWLFWADRTRVVALLDALWAIDHRIFMDTDLVGRIWSSRAMFSPTLVVNIATAWAASDNEVFRQAAAEFVQGLTLVDPDGSEAATLAPLLYDISSPELTGRLFSAASAWQEEDQNLRSRAHEILLQFSPDAEADQAHAISTAVDRTRTLIPDDLTRKMVMAVAENRNLLAASLNGRFSDALQTLLLYPDFDEIVLFVTEQIADLIVDKKGAQSLSFMDRDYVQLTVALQRNDGSIRARAMDVYEKLLDAGAYGAEDAAKASIGR